MNQNEGYNYKVLASGCEILVLADQAERAMEIAHMAYPRAELLYAKHRGNSFGKIGYYMIEKGREEFPCFSLGKPGEFPIRKLNGEYDFVAVENLSGCSFRRATVGDFRRFGINMDCVWLIYSESEAMECEGALFWNDKDGFVSLEDANVYSVDETDGMLPTSRLNDAAFCHPDFFLDKANGEPIS